MLGTVERRGRDTTPAGYLERAGDRVDPIVGWHHSERHPGYRVMGGHSRKVDAREFARLTSTPVRADEVLRGQFIGAIRTVDMHDDTVGVLVESDQSVSPAQIGAVVADSLGQNLHQPGLLDGEHEVLWIRHSRQIQCHGREHRPRRRLRGIGSSGQDAVEAAMVEQPNRLTGNPIRAPLRVGSGQRLQHDGPHTGQSEFTRQHQPIRACTGDDDVIHLAQLTSRAAGL